MKKMELASYFLIQVQDRLCESSAAPLFMSDDIEE